MPKILDEIDKEPLCELFFTPEELDEEFKPEKIEINNDSLNLFTLHQQAFFSYDSSATMEEWDKYVESDLELVKIRNKGLGRL